MLPEASRVGAGRFCTYFIIIIILGKGVCSPKLFGGFNSDGVYGNCLSPSSAY